MIGELAALGAAICWTISAVLYKEALLSTKPISANIVRCVCTSAGLLALLLVVGKFSALVNLPMYAVVFAVVSGIVGLGLGDTLYLVSLKSIGVARSVPLTCTYPLFSLVWAVFLQGEHLTFQVVLGAVAIVLGVWLLGQGEDKNTVQNGKRLLIKGTVSALTAAVIWSVSIAMIDIAVTLPETSTFDSALALNTIRVSAVAVFLFALIPIVDRKLGFLKVERKTLIALTSGGLVALGLGWFLLSLSFILNTPESQAVPISSTTPLFSTFSGIVFLRERVTAKTVAGSMIIVVGIFLLFML